MQLPQMWSYLIWLKGKTKGPKCDDNLRHKNNILWFLRVCCKLYKVYHYLYLLPPSYFYVQNGLVMMHV